jgi:hypothetical protein
MYKKIFLPTFLLLTILSSFSSCKKDTESLTPAEVIANQINEVIKQQNIGRVYAIINGAIPAQYDSNAGRNWRISNGFFGSTNLNQQTYNLAYLTSYNIENVQLNDGTRAPALLLRFKY